MKLFDMIEYKLYHFNTSFLAEPIRLIFVYAKVPVNFEDVRVSIREWKNLKKKTPWGQLPMLEMSDGRVLGQSRAIAEFLGKRFNLAGDTEFDLFRCNEISHSLEDMRHEWSKVFFQKHPDRKCRATKLFLTHTIPRFFQRFSEMQAETGGLFLVCDRITYADLLFAHNAEFFEETIEGDIFAKFPKLKELRDYIYGLEEIKEYLDNRIKCSVNVLNLISIAG